MGGLWGCFDRARLAPICHSLRLERKPKSAKNAATLVPQRCYSLFSWVFRATVAGHAGGSTNRLRQAPMISRTNIVETKGSARDDRPSPYSIFLFTLSKGHRNGNEI